MGVPDYLGWDWKSKAGIPIVCVPGCPIQPDNLSETLTYLLYMATGQAPMIPLDEALRPTWLFGQTVHEGCDRAGYYEQGDFATEYGSPKCIVKLGCWGPVVKCNVPKRGWMNGIGGCPNVGGICIGCTMPGFPDKFMPFMDEPPGGKLSTAAVGLVRRDDAHAAPHDHPHRRQGTEVAQTRQDPDHRRHPHLVVRHTPQRGSAMTSTIPSPTSYGEDKITGLVEMAWDPITRIVGSLGIYTKIDFDNKTVAECHSTSSIFRGYSIFMKGKDPRDAHFITSRICGICGDNHATCSCYAQNMAYGVKPPHLGEWIVNLGEAAEYMFDHNIFQENLVGVDYCEKMVAETNPGVLEQANRTEAPHADAHGYRTIGDIMRSLNPFTGEFYREALQVSRWTREMFCLMEGRHVHPSTLYPGGVGTVATIQLMTDYITRLMRYVEFMKKVVPMHDDLFDFFYEALPGYEEVGNRRILLGCWGSFQDPEVLQLRLQGHDRVGPEDVRHPGRRRRRQAGHHRPGRDQPRHPDPARLVVLRRLGGPGDVRQERPAGQPGRPAAPVEPAHQPEAAEARPRRQVLLGDVAALVRRQGLPRPRHRRRTAGPAVGHRAGRARRHRLREVHRLERARSTCPRPRSRARSSWSGRSRSGATRSSATAPAPTSRPTRRPARCTSPRRRWSRSGPAAPRPGRSSTVPDEAIGCGFTEAVRGVLSHHMVIRDGKIANYHPYPPTPWNANPRDSYGTPGPYEDAVQGQPIFEENDREHFKGIDIMRTVRSFDPCLPCGVHMYLGDGMTLEMLHSPTQSAGIE